MIRAVRVNRDALHNTRNRIVGRWRIGLKAQIHRLKKRQDLGRQDTADGKEVLFYFVGILRKRYVACSVEVADWTLADADLSNSFFGSQDGFDQVRLVQMDVVIVGI